MYKIVNAEDLFKELKLDNKFHWDTLKAASDSDTSVALTFEKMYNWDDESGLTFDHLETISKFFGTKNINVGQVECHSTGCETCGYGGQYDIVLYLKECTKNI